MAWSPGLVEAVNRRRKGFRLRWTPFLFNSHKLWQIGERITWSPGLGPLLLVAGVILLWGLSLAGIDPRQMNDLGLLSILPLSVYAALVILVISFCLAVHQRQTREPVLLLHLVVFIIIIHATPILLYGTLRYSWAWKHIGLVDYIQRHGSVDPHIATLSAYHNWPGFFALSAFITETTGLKSSLSLALWAPPFFNLLDLGALLLIVKTFTTDRRLIWLSLWFFFLTNWVGQDYFSPQALSYFFHLVILGICLRWFAVMKPPSKSALKGWLMFDWATSLCHSFASQLAQGGTLTNTASRPFLRAGLITIIVAIYAVIASSHQLTPFMTIIALVALVSFQRCRMRSLPILITSIALTWIIFMAVVFLEGEVQDLIASIGQLSENVDSNLINLAQASPGQRLVAMMGRGLTVFLWGLAFLGGFRRFRQGYWDVSAALLALAPFGILAGNSYGGEAIFRVYLFSLPGMAFFAAGLLYPGLAAGTSWRTALTTVVVSGMLLTGFLFAYYGKEKQFYFTQKEVDAATYLYNVAPENSLLIEGARNYPTLFHNYEFYTNVAISREPPESLMRVLNQPVENLHRWMANQRYAAAYLIITRSQKAEVDALGEIPAGSLDRLEQALLQSDKFKVIFENEDARIFTLANDGRGAEP